MNIYNNYKYLVKNGFSKNIISFLIILFILYIILIFIINIPFTKYKQFKMTLLENNIYELYLKEEDIEIFKNTLSYQNQKYSFKIIKIDPNYYFNAYRRLTISVDFKINIPNKIYEILIYDKKTTFLKEIMKEVL